MGKRITVNDDEYNALHDAVDFIQTHADGADDYEPFQKMMDDINSLIEKVKRPTKKRANVPAALASIKKRYGI